MEQAQQTRPVIQMQPVTPISVLWYALSGCAVGLVLGILFAPKSGKETRDDLADLGRQGRDKSRGLFEKIRESMPGRKAAEVEERVAEAVR